MPKVKRNKKKDKEKKVKQKKVVTERKVIEQTANCKVEVINNMLPWEREVLSEHSHFRFTMKDGKKYTVKYDERSKALSIECNNDHAFIQLVSVNQFLIK